MIIREKALVVTASGSEIDLLNPNPAHIHIEDIAHQLAMQPRFAGATRFFYSVAQHSLMVARACPENERLWGLLHDASEAFLSDLVSPIKHHLQDYIITEGILLRAICSRFGLTWPAPRVVKEMDMEIGALEKRALIQGQGTDMCRAQGFQEQDWRESKRQYLTYFEEYKVESAEALRLLSIAEWQNDGQRNGAIVMRHPDTSSIIQIEHPARKIPLKTMIEVQKALQARLTSIC